MQAYALDELSLQNSIQLIIAVLLSHTSNKNSS